MGFVDESLFEIPTPLHAPPVSTDDLSADPVQPRKIARWLGNLCSTPPCHGEDLCRDISDIVARGTEASKNIGMDRGVP